jgi:hypothetical protein
MFVLSKKNQRYGVSREVLCFIRQGRRDALFLQSHAV